MKALEDQLISDIARYSKDPLGCVLYSFPWGEPGSELETVEGPYPWQREILDTIGKHLRSEFRFQPLKIAVSSGRGIGKSALIAMLSHWGLSTCDDTRIIVTANTEPQLATKTWPEISKWFRRSINKHWWTQTATRICVKDSRHADTWRIDRETWSENNVEAFRGLHNIGKRMIFIFDEAAGIPEPIWRATEGSLTDEGTEMIWVAFSNPSQPDGAFYDCFETMKHRWVTRQIDSRTVPGTNKQEIERWIEDFGDDSDFVRVNVRGLFPRAGGSQFIGGAIVREAKNRKVGDQSKAYKVLSVDVARFGDDQSVIGQRQGLSLKMLDKLRGADVVQVAQRVMYHIQVEEPRMAVVDGDGIGGGVVDYVRFHLREWIEKRPWFRLVEFHGGNTPGDVFMYLNKRAEVWGRARAWLETGSIPDDPELIADLTGPRYLFSNKNQIQLEKKEDMKKRGVPSPDCGDMLAMTFTADATKKTRDEQLTEEIQKVEAKDPMEAHFMRLKETERRKKQNQPLNYWD